LRVLHVYKDYWPVTGGIEGNVRELAIGLRRSYGVDTRVLATSPGRRGRRGTVDGVPVWQVGRLGVVARAPIAPGLLWALRRLPCDVADLHFPYPVGELAYLAAGRGRRLVVTYHSDIVRQQALLAVYRPFLELLLRRADRIVATSPRYAETSPWLRRFGDRVVVIPYGIDVDRFARTGAASCDHGQAQLGADAPVVLFVGHYRYYKGLEHLIRALPQVDPPARLVLVGAGIEAELAPLARQLGVADRTVFAGEAGAALPGYYAAADVFCLPSSHRSEAFGIVLLEAMAAGLPLVSTELGTGTSWVNRDGDTGLVVPPADPAALAAALNRLLGNPDLRRRFGAAGRARVEAEFTLARMLERRYRLYTELA